MSLNLTIPNPATGSTLSPSNWSSGSDSMGIQQLRNENAELKRLANRLQGQRDHFRSELDRVLREYMPIPPSDEEWQKTIENPLTLDRALEEIGKTEGEGNVL